LSIRAILSEIIKRHELGRIVGISSEPWEGESKILELVPDIVLIDFLMGKKDGVEVIKELKGKGFDGIFVMISQVSDKEMVAKAYSAGIEYFITKPVNVIEVVSVINRVIDNLSLRQTLSTIDKSLRKIKDRSEDKSVRPLGLEMKIKRILGDLGILGEPGALDIIHSCNIIGEAVKNYILKEVYKEVAVSFYNKYENEEATIKAIEQRIRRAVIMALENIAHIGIEDYSDERFTNYSSCLFDFKEIKNEMDFIRKKSSYRGKVNIKKFLEGILLMANMN
jgi:two-component system, response regulator YcbB